jgi:hypothetical protein
MPDNQLFGGIDEITPNFNSVVVDGLATKEMRMVEGHVDRIFRTAQTGFPEGLEYVGYRVCTPEEEVREVIERANRGKRVSRMRTTLELSHSSVYLVKYFFRYFGEPIDDQHLFLPYIKDGGLVTIRGSTYTISPTLADNTLSIGVNTIFIQMSCGKLTFERRSHNFMRNDERETVYVVSSQIHNHRDKKGDEPRFKVGAAHTLVNYLFCRYGLHKTFEIYANADVVVGYSSDITEELYPKDQYYICRSTRLKPPGMKGNRYDSSDIHLAIPKSQWSPLAANLIGGFFYLVDFYPQQIDPQYVDNQRLWMVILGYVIFGQGGSDGRLIEDIQDHLVSLDKYLNGEIQQALILDGIEVEDIYGFFIKIIETMSQRIATHSSNLSSMYGKKLMVMRFALSDINHAIFNLMFRLQKSAKKNLNKLEVTNLMRRTLKPELIIDLNKDHGEVSSASAPGDNKFFKITSLLVPQSSSSNSKRRKGKAKAKVKSNASDPTKYLHVSIAEVGAYTNLPKSDPIGHSRISPYVHLKEDNSIARNPELVPLLDSTQLVIQR